MSHSKSNVEFITELMEFSSMGPMTQVFIVHMLHAVATRIANDPNPERFSNGLMEGTYWVQLAQHVKDRMDEHYGSLDCNVAMPG